MELTFDKATGICEFEVTADFNLHLEREDVGTLHFYQRTTPHGEYDYIKNQGYNADDKVIDLDFQSLVYPKWIMIKSAVIPTVATISTDGEVREVSYQAKEIEITSNGTTKVTADTGYTALGSVNVKVNVPQSGGSAGDSGESGMTYFDLRLKGRAYEKALTLYPAIYINAFVEGQNTSICGAVPLFGIPQDFYGYDVAAVGFNITDIAIMGEQEMPVLRPELEEFYNSCPKLTKDEFFHLKPLDVVIDGDSQDGLKTLAGFSSPSDPLTEWVTVAPSYFLNSIILNSSILGEPIEVTRIQRNVISSLDDTWMEYYINDSSLYIHHDFNSDRYELRTADV